MYTHEIIFNEYCLQRTAACAGETSSTPWKQLQVISWPLGELSSILISFSLKIKWQQTLNPSSLLAGLCVFISQSMQPEWDHRPALIPSLYMEPCCTEGIDFLFLYCNYLRKQGPFCPEKNRTIDIFPLMGKENYKIFMENCTHDYEDHCYKDNPLEGELWEVRGIWTSTEENWA